MSNIKHKSVRIINDGKFLMATMPNGDIIPMQVDCIVTNGLRDRGEVNVTITLKAVLSSDEFEIARPLIKCTE